MPEALVAGHICLDIIPTLAEGMTFEPGKLVEAGPARISTGGAVSNTGRVLNQLGVEASLVGKIGDDIFGRNIQELLGPLGSQMVVAEGEETSYTLVINLKGHDRMFLHNPGCNNTFTADDVTDKAMGSVRLMHFGYPPLMRRFYEDGGEQLLSLFSRAKRHGLTTSLDLSLPDPDSASGKVDWVALLKKVLPFVDVFVPSLDELQFMVGAGDVHLKALDWGAKIVAIKHGSHGLSVRSGSRLEDMGRGVTNVADWEGVQLHQPCFAVDVAGTTGAGDATIAGFLMGLLKGMSPAETCEAATAVGACCCEQVDATSGVPSWIEVKNRLSCGWVLNEA